MSKGLIGAASFIITGHENTERHLMNWRQSAMMERRAWMGEERRFYVPES